MNEIELMESLSKLDQTFVELDKKIDLLSTKRWDIHQEKERLRRQYILDNKILKQFTWTLNINSDDVIKLVCNEPQNLCNLYKDVIVERLWLDDKCSIAFETNMIDYVIIIIYDIDINGVPQWIKEMKTCVNIYKIDNIISDCEFKIKKCESIKSEFIK